MNNFPSPSEDQNPMAGSSLPSNIYHSEQYAGSFANVFSVPDLFSFKAKSLLNINASVLQGLVPPYTFEPIFKNIVPGIELIAPNIVADFAAQIPTFDAVAHIVHPITTLAPSMLADYLQTAMPAIMSHIGLMSQGLSNTLTNWNPPYLQTIQAMNQALWVPPAFLDISGLADTMSHLTSSLAMLSNLFPSNLKHIGAKLKQRLLDAFRRIGFCLAPSMSEDLIYHILDLVEGGDLRPVTLCIWNYYAQKDHARLQVTVERWQRHPEYARRCHTVLLPALDAHRRKQYALSIRALVPEVEGISSHFVKQNAILGEKKGKDGSLNLGATRDILLRTVKIAGKDAQLDIHTTDIMQWVRVKSIIDYFENIFCKKLHFERDYDDVHLKNHQIHRHGLLHGIQLGAFSAFNSLRLFLILDTLNELLQNP